MSQDKQDPYVPLPKPADRQFEVPVDNPLRIHLTITGSDKIPRISGKGPGNSPIMPQAPEAIDGQPVPSTLPVTTFTDFQGLIDLITYSVSSNLDTVVENYATMASVYSRVASMLLNNPDWEDFLNETVEGTGGKTVNDYFGAFNTGIQKLEGVAKEGWELPGFPRQWPPAMNTEESGIEDVVFTMKSVPHTYTGEGGSPIFEDTYFILKLYMDTQGYHIPRGFTLDVHSQQKVGPLVSSSSSSAYSSDASPYGDDIDPDKN